MIVDEVNVRDVTSREPKYDAPVSGYRNTPEAVKVPAQRMQPQTRKVHVARHPGKVEIAENANDSFSMCGMNARGIAAIMQPPQAPMPETADHA
jgi:hypothetical protein